MEETRSVEALMLEARFSQSGIRATLNELIQNLTRATLNGDVSDLERTMIPIWNMRAQLRTLSALMEEFFKSYAQDQQERQQVAAALLTTTADASPNSQDSGTEPVPTSPRKRKRTCELIQPLKDTGTIPIYTLTGLSNRIYNRLTRGGIHTVEALDAFVTSHGYKSLSRIPDMYFNQRSFGSDTIKKIREAHEQYKNTSTPETT